MKVLNGFLLTALLTTNSVIPAFAGGNSGGGGGGICMRDKCMTLAEAGIRIADDSNKGKWYVPAAVLSQLNHITSKIPFGRGKILSLALGDVNTFTRVESVSKSLLRQVKKDYVNVLKETNHTSLIDNLEIFAISSGSTTYLLPSFFTLDDYQKSLVLIHEGVVRKFKQDYRLALQFDGLLLDYFSRVTNPSYSPLTFYRVLAHISGEKRPQALYAVQYIETKLGRKLSFLDFHPASVQVWTGPLKNHSYRKLLENQAVADEFMDVFGQASINGGSHLTKEMILKEYTHSDLEVACADPALKRFVRLDRVLYPKLVFYNCNSLDEKRIFIAFELEMDLVNGVSLSNREIN